MKLLKAISISVLTFVSIFLLVYSLLQNNLIQELKSENTWLQETSMELRDQANQLNERNLDTSASLRKKEIELEEVREALEDCE